MMDASDETIRLPVPTAEKIFVNILLIPNLYSYFDSIHWLVFAFHLFSFFLKRGIEGEEAKTGEENGLSVT